MAQCSELPTTSARTMRTDHGGPWARRVQRGEEVSWSVCGQTRQLELHAYNWSSPIVSGPWADMVYPARPKSGPSGPKGSSKPQSIGGPSGPSDGRVIRNTDIMALHPKVVCRGCRGVPLGGSIEVGLEGLESEEGAKRGWGDTSPFTTRLAFRAILSCCLLR